MSDPIGAFFDRRTRRPPERLLCKTSGSIRFELTGDHGVDLCHVTIGDGRLRNDMTAEGQFRFVVLIERLFAASPGARHPRSLTRSPEPA